MPLLAPAAVPEPLQRVADDESQLDSGSSASARPADDGEGGQEGGGDESGGSDSTPPADKKQAPSTDAIAKDDASAPEKAGPAVATPPTRPHFAADSIVECAQCKTCMVTPERCAKLRCFSCKTVIEPSPVKPAATLGSGKGEVEAQGEVSDGEIVPGRKSPGVAAARTTDVNSAQPNDEAATTMPSPSPAKESNGNGGELAQPGSQADDTDAPSADAKPSPQGPHFAADSVVECARCKTCMAAPRRCTKLRCFKCKALLEPNPQNCDKNPLAGEAQQPGKGLAVAGSSSPPGENGVVWRVHRRMPSTLPTLLPTAKQSLDSGRRTGMRVTATKKRMVTL